MGLTPFTKCFCFAAFNFLVTGVSKSSVGETNFGLLLFAILFANKALAPNPLTAPFVALPRGACGRTMWAACEGLCIGCIGAGESDGVEGADIVGICIWYLTGAAAAYEAVERRLDLLDFFWETSSKVNSTKNASKCHVLVSSHGHVDTNQKKKRCR